MITQYITMFFAVLVPMIIMDGVWLGVISKSFYARHLGFLMTSHPNWVAIIIFYILYAVGIVVFVVQPGLVSGASVMKIALLGAFLGLVAYGTYDLTSHAIVNNWPGIVTVVDMIWGAFITGAVSVIAYMVLK